MTPHDQILSRAETRPLRGPTTLPDEDDPATPAFVAAAGGNGSGPAGPAPERPAGPAPVAELWRLPDDEVYQALGSSASGLAEDEAFKRLQEHGHNVLPAKVSRPIIFKFLDQFTSLFAIMLEVAAVLVFIAAMLSTGSARQDNINVTIAIIAVVLLNGVIGFFQEYRAEKATEALQKLVPANAKVVRDGEVTRRGRRRPGPRRPAGAGGGRQHQRRRPRRAPVRALDQQHRPHRRVRRGAQDGGPILEEELAVINMPNLVFMGTSVAAGTGRAVVFNTGLETEFGRIFTLTAGVSDEKSPLLREIDRMARTVSTIAVFCGVLLFVLALLVFHFGAVPALLFALGVMVALVPEGLPATLSVALSIGVQRMAKAKALIKNLGSVETLGCTNVICTDKTGTLTKAEMTVKALYVGGQDVEVTGAGYEPVGGFVVDGAELSRTDAKRRLEPMMRAMTFCNDAKVLPPSDDQGWRVIGDPTEGCLLVAAQKADFDVQTELIERPKIYELPFESVRKRMSVVHVEGDGQKAYVKGAPSETLSRCTRMRLDGDVVAMTDELRERIAAQNDEMSRQALRVLAVCERDLPNAARRLHARRGRDRPHLPRPGRHDRPAAARGQRGRGARADRRHPHHHGDRRLRADGRGHRPPHRHRPRRRARARDHRRRPGGHDGGGPQGRAPEAPGRPVRASRSRAQDAGRERPQGARRDRRRHRRRRERRPRPQEGRHRRGHGPDGHRRLA